MGFIKDREAKLKPYLSVMSKTDIMARRTGRTFAEALGYVSEAMKKPYKKVRIYDHTPGAIARNNCFNTVSDIIHDLNLEGFTLNKKTLTVIYKPHTDAFRILYGQEGY
jgi:hypothetical protein